ncbi:MAG: 23S rRNA (pseudouridine(1915)-N(3))-methyltransferase RlmH [Marinirhabdus sp.]
MKITLLAVGKTDNKNLEQLISLYSKRLQHYVSFSFEMVPDVKKVKKFSQTQQKEAEGRALLKKIEPSSCLVLLDEKGTGFSSLQFSAFLQKKMNSGLRHLTFCIGGPYGFSEEICTRSDHNVSLSKMTFSHQMVRLFFTEQLYRGFTILNNQPYHHG